jgi:Fe-S-cluster containining protein
MDYPTHNRSVFNYKGKKIEFYYPSSLRWNCIKCGRCCKDIDGWDRRVLLLKKDVDGIKEAGYNNFYKQVEEGKYIAIMQKNEEKCIFFEDDKCKIYLNRALLCRMYPFYVDKIGDIFVIYVDDTCMGLDEGNIIVEKFYRDLLEYALDTMGY